MQGTECAPARNRSRSLHPIQLAHPPLILSAQPFSPGKTGGEGSQNDSIAMVSAANTNVTNLA